MYVTRRVHTVGCLVSEVQKDPIIRYSPGFNVAKMNYVLYYGKVVEKQGAHWSSRFPLQRSRKNAAVLVVYDTLPHRASSYGSGLV